MRLGGAALPTGQLTYRAICPRANAPYRSKDGSRAGGACRHVHVEAGPTGNLISGVVILDLPDAGGGGIAPPLGCQLAAQFCLVRGEAHTIGVEGALWIRVDIHLPLQQLRCQVCA